MTSDFTTLELSPSLRTAFLGWTKIIRAKNVHWISTSQFDRLKTSEPQYWKWTMDAEQASYSLRPVQGDENLAIWKQVVNLTILDSRKKLWIKPVVIGDQKNQHLFMIVRGPQERTTLGYVVFENIKDVSERHLKALEKLVLSDARHLEFCCQHQHAKAQSFMDDLTSLYNQRYLPVVFEREISRSSRLSKKFSVLFMDIDFFKKVNDTRGHWIGSKLLIEVSKLIQQTIRTSDYGFRYGGDEFVIVLVDTDLENGQNVAERIRSRIEQQEFVVEGISLKLTVSIGMASYPDHAKSTVELIKLADQAMYYGKSKSRNIVFCAG